MRTKITAGVLIVFFAGAFVIYAANRGYSAQANPLGQTSAGSESLNPDSQTPSSASGGSNPQAPSSNAKTYTASDVAKHSTQASCWTVIGGKVYDLTSWIGQHPGGAQAIISLCGKDGSAAFNAQHGGQARPAQELAAFYIGDLGSVTSAGPTGSTSSGASASSNTGTGSGTALPSAPNRSTNNNDDD